MSNCIVPSQMATPFELIRFLRIRSLLRHMEPCATRTTSMGEPDECPLHQTTLPFHFILKFLIKVAMVAMVAMPREQTQTRGQCTRTQRRRCGEQGLRLAQHKRCSGGVRVRPGIARALSQPVPIAALSRALTSARPVSLCRACLLRSGAACPRVPARARPAPRALPVRKARRHVFDIARRRPIALRSHRARSRSLLTAAHATLVRAPR